MFRPSAKVLTALCSLAALTMLATSDGRVAGVRTAFELLSAKQERLLPSTRAISL